MQTRRAIAEALRRIPYFARLGEAPLAALAGRVRVRHHASGDMLAVEGWPSKGLFFVVRGHVRVYRVTPDGREQVLRVVGPGGTFNDAAAFDEGPCAESAIALGPATTGLVPGDTLCAMLDGHPEIARAATRVLAARHRAMGQVVEDLALRDVTARVARLLLGCAGRRSYMVEGAPDACARITHQEIATMIGSVREVVQRSLKELERAGAIKLGRARINIVDADILERLSETPSDDRKAGSDG